MFNDLKNMFEELGLTPAQIRLLVETVIDLEDPMRVVKDLALIGSKGRRKAYARVLNWDENFIYKMICEVYSKTYANRIFNNDGTFALVKGEDGHFSVSAGYAGRKLHFSNARHLALFLVMTTFAYFTKHEGLDGVKGHVRRPRNLHTGVEAPEGTEFLLVGTNNPILTGDSKRKSYLSTQSAGKTVSEMSAYCGYTFKTVGVKDTNKATKAFNAVASANTAFKTEHNGVVDLSPVGRLVGPGFLAAQEIRSSKSILVSQRLVDTLRKYEVLGNLDTSNWYVMPEGAILNWFSLDFKSADVMYLMMLIEACSIKQGTRQFVCDPKANEITFGEDKITMDKALLYDYRGRWAHLTAAVDGADAYLTNGFGSFIKAVIESFPAFEALRSRASKTSPCGNSWYRMLVNKGMDYSAADKEDSNVDVVLPFCSEAEAGALDKGDRHHHLRYVVYPYHIASTPIITSDGMLDTSIKRERYVHMTAFKSVELTELWLDKYNLAHMQKSASMFLFDGRLLGLRLRTLGVFNKEQHGIDGHVLFTALAKYHTGEPDGVRAIKSLMGLSVNDNLGLPSNSLFFRCEELFAKFIMALSYCANSTKIQKLVSRIGVAVPAHADGFDLEARAMALFEQLGGFSPAHVYTCMHLRNAVSAPGMGFLISSLKEIIEPSYVSGTYEHLVRDRYGLAVKDVAKVDVDDDHKRTIISYDELEFTALLNGGRASAYTGLVVNKGDVIISFPYKNSKGEEMIENVHAKDDCIIKSIELETNVYGSLVVHVNVHKIRNKAKLRQLVKLMITYHMSSTRNSDRPDLIYNALNADVPLVDLIITGDADKSKDHGQGLCDIAAETFSRNDKEYLSSFNARMGIDSNSKLYWNSLLGMGGVYDELATELDRRYGRSIWLKHRDVNPGVFTAMRDAYLNVIKDGGDKGLWREVNAQEAVVELDLTLEQLRAAGLITVSIDEEKVIDECLKPLTCIVSDVTKSGKITKHDEVYFFVDEGEYMTFWQRTYGFIGNAEHGDVHIALKAEMSTIDQNVSSSVSMYSTAECIDSGLGDWAPAGDLAREFMRSARTNGYKWSALQAIISGAPIVNENGVTLPVVKVFDSNEGVVTLSEEFKAFITDELRSECKDRIDFAKLAYFFKDVRLDFSVPRVKSTSSQGVIEIDMEGNDAAKVAVEAPAIWLPAIAAQSTKVDGQEDLSGLVYDCVRMAINGVGYEAINERAKRIRGCLAKLKTSKKARKAPMSGRSGVMVKLHAVTEIPVGEIWLGQAYGETMSQAVARALGDLDIKLSKDGELYAVVARSPIPFAGKLKVRFVRPWEAAYKLFKAAYACVNPLIGYLSGGDFDGDGYNIIFLRPEEHASLKVVDYKDILDLIEVRTGLPALSNAQEGYIRDHWFPKTWKGKVGADGELDIRAYSTANFCFFSKEVKEVDGALILQDDASVLEAYGIVGTLQAGGKTRTSYIGLNHCLAFMQSAWFNQTKKLGLEEIDSAFDMAGWEMYEGNPLGGLNWKGWAVNKMLEVWRTESITNDNKDMFDLDRAEHLISKAGLNGLQTKRYYDVFRAYFELYGKYGFAETHELVLKVSGKQLCCEDFVMHDTNLGTLRSVASLLMYRVGRAVFNPIAGFSKDELGNPTAVINVDLALALYVWTFDPTKMEALRKESLVLDHLMFYIEQCLPAFDFEKFNKLMAFRGSTLRPSFKALGAYADTSALLTYRPEAEATATPVADAVDNPVASPTK